ncbi:MAG: outer membrane lipoprotein chaperone LolA [Alphaproteobacteria bacterium]|nr:outer membrane lipoprotein chaperone LolA [Alphaproteobacteria bacterium]
MIRHLTLCVLKRFGRMWALACGLLFANPWAWADGVQALQDFLQHSRSGRAEFVQQVTGPARAGQPARVKNSRGTLAYQRPDLFRLEYTSPDVQVLLADGRQFWHADHDLQQATVRDQKAVLASAPAALILTASDVQALRAAFLLRDLPASDGLSWVEVTPKSTEGTLRQLRVGLQGQGAATRVSVLEFTDGFGQTSRLELSAYESPARLPAGTFQYKPPAGFQVLRP